MSTPLTKLTKKDVKFEWTDKCKESFQKLKHKLILAPILALPISGKEITIYTNASIQGLGCILMQDRKVIAYTSRQLKPHEQKYQVYELELATVILALKLWRHYLFGEKYKVYMDHKVLSTYTQEAEYEIEALARTNKGL